MYRGLTKAGLGAVQSDKQLIELAAAGGFRAVDTDAKLLIQQYGEQGAQDLLAQHGVILGSIGLTAEWRGDEETFLAGLPALAEEAAAAKKLGCTRCCTYILPSTDLKASHFAMLATRRLRICARILGAYGIRLGLEFVGPHHLRTAWKYPFIWTMDETLDWIEAIGEPNVGLLFDAYHWYTNGHTIADIERLGPHQIVHVHLNDAPDVPIEEVRDNERLYPGEGVIDLPGVLRALKNIGYQGAVSQEILTPSAPQETPDALLRRSKEGFDRVFAAAGLEG